jgi:glutamate--cysteine ligase
MPLTRADLADDLLAASFGRGGMLPDTAGRIGAEVEFIPVEGITGRRCAIETEGVPSILPVLRPLAARLHWTEGRTSKGTPCFSLPGGGSITFEPGGQIEYSSPPCDSAAQLLAVLRAVVQPLCVAAAAEGIDLLAVGIDPFNSIDQSPLLLRVPRYERMADYFATRGPAGARMMRQTASFQINLDFGTEPWLRWRVLNAASPFVTAIFANSSIYRRKPAGYQSARAAVWRQVDVTRTGVVYDQERPVEAYLDFALAAPAILYPTVSGEYRSFADWIALANPSLGEWHDHLTTLFPEVRPRGHLELRSPDAVSPAWYAAPIALVSGILYDPEALRAADDLLGSPDPGLLERAGECGLRDPSFGRTGADLFEIGLRGCRALGPGWFHPADLEQATTYFDNYTRRGRAPADDGLGKAIAA